MSNQTRTGLRPFVRLLAEGVGVVVLAAMVASQVLAQSDRYPWFEGGAVSFAPQVTYVAGKSPFTVVALDVNEDGRLDLAVPNRDAATVTILLGRDDGTFVPSAVEFPWVDCPIGIGAGDFNLDGHLDLAVINHLCNTVTIVAGRGDGTWLSRVDFQTGAEPRAIAVADFNNDRRPDLAIANRLEGTVSLLFGNGDGSFRPRVDYPAELNPHAVVAGDFNGDGLADLAVASTGTSTVTIYRNRGDGVMAPLPSIAAGSGSTALAALDLNRDGRPDLVVVDVVSDVVSVLPGRGDFTFGERREYAAGDSPIDVRGGDFNGDGNIDVVVADRDPSMVTILLGKGDGTFAATTHLNHFATGLTPYGVAVGDFNRDGRPDIATANFVGTSVSVLLNEEPRFANLRVTQTTSAASLAAGRTLTLTVRVANSGPDVSRDVRLSDALPAKMTLVSCTASGGGVCGPNGADLTASLTVSWNEIAVGSGEEATIILRGNNDICGDDRLFNIVSVTARTGDPILEDNLAELLVVGDNLPPAITGSADLLALSPRPGARLGTLVSYGAPVALDNTSGVSVNCTRASGSLFPHGITSVVCTATDLCGLTAAWRFNVSVFDILLLDDRNRHFLLFDSFTGDYVFRRADNDQEYRGRGRITRTRCEIRLKDNSRLEATFNTCLLRGWATFRPLIIAPTLTISDRWTGDSVLPPR